MNVPPHKAPRRTNRRRRSEDRQDTLTPRETEVLQLLAAGKSTPGIAKELGVSPHTVRTHVQNTMAKLDARSKMDAVAQARRLGLPGLALDRRETG